MIAALFNTVRDSKRRREPFKPEEFNPYTPKKKPTFADFGKLIRLSDYESRKQAGELPCRSSQKTPL